MAIQEEDSARFYLRAYGRAALAWAKTALRLWLRDATTGQIWASATLALVRTLYQELGVATESGVETADISPSRNESG